MTRWIVTILGVAAVVGGALVADAAAQTPVRVVVRTELGDIVLEVDTKSAPNSDAQRLTPPIKILKAARVR